MTTTLTAPITGDVTIKPYPKTRRLIAAERRLAMARDGHASPETLAILQRRVQEAGGSVQPVENHRIVALRRALLTEVPMGAAVAWLTARAEGETDPAVLAFIAASTDAVVAMLEGMVARRAEAVAA